MSGTGQRIDKWLFFARVTKSRSLAAKLAQSGRIRVNRDKIGQASHVVKVGDVLTITLDRQVLVLEVLAPGERRGPYQEARLLYRDRTPPLPPKEERLASALPPAAPGGQPAGRRSANAAGSTRHGRKPAAAASAEAGARVREGDCREVRRPRAVGGILFPSGAGRRTALALPSAGKLVTSPPNTGCSAGVPS